MMNHLKMLGLTLCMLLSANAFSAELVKNKTVLTLAGAKVIAAGAFNKAKAENWNVIIAITDASGTIKYLERMENVQLASLDVAIAKAKTSVVYRRPTKAFETRVKNGDMAITMLPDVMPFAGGLPIVINGEIIGAIGVSGVKSSQDAEIAQAGIDEFLKKLSN